MATSATPVGIVRPTGLKIPYPDLEFIAEGSVTGNVSGGEMTVSPALPAGWTTQKIWARKIKALVIQSDDAVSVQFRQSVEIPGSGTTLANLNPSSNYFVMSRRCTTAAVGASGICELNDGDYTRRFPLWITRREAEVIFSAMTANANTKRLMLGIWVWFWTEPAPGGDYRVPEL